MGRLIIVSLVSSVLVCTSAFAEVEVISSQGVEVSSSSRVKGPYVRAEVIHKEHDHGHTGHKKSDPEEHVHNDNHVHTKETHDKSDTEDHAHDNHDNSEETKHNRRQHKHDHEETEHLHEKPGSKTDLAALSASLGGIHSTIWLASLGSILVISLVGLLAVAALPLLRGTHQQATLQVLVSLAVGTLVGDSLIHLIPHAFGTQHGDTSVVWKGFTATLTIIAFFVLDQSMAALGHGHSHGQGHGHGHSDVEEGSEGTRTTRESTPVFKETKMPPMPQKKISESSKASEDSGVIAGSEGVGSLYSLYRHHSYQSLPRGTSPPAASPCAMPSSSRMVILGDAVHNFADGLAVGAAFSLSLAAGLSTSLAVLCHELPHEVGDFALLLSQGMSARKAIFYNIVSSIFAALGLLVGLLLGSHEGLSSWLLSATVGVFLYVALVSMMTELRGGGLAGICLNTAGMLGGAVLLLAIGLYEQDLILLFDPSAAHDH